MEKRRVINIERDFAHEREGFVAIFVIVNSDIARDQPAKWIEGQTADGGFDTALMEFFHHGVAPVAAESFPGQIPSARRETAEDKNDRETKQRARDPTRA